MAQEAEILAPFGKYEIPGSAEDVIEALEAALEKARKGELISVVIGGATRNKKVWTMFRGGTGGLVELIGCIECVKDDILAAYR